MCSQPFEAPKERELTTVYLVCVGSTAATCHFHPSIAVRIAHVINDDGMHFNRRFPPVFRICDRKLRASGISCRVLFVQCRVGYVAE
jgi:hypothetical protein